MFFPNRAAPPVADFQEALRKPHLSTGYTSSTKSSGFPSPAGQQQQQLQQQPESLQQYQQQFANIRPPMSGYGMEVSELDASASSSPYHTNNNPYASMGYPSFPPPPPNTSSGNAMYGGGMQMQPPGYAYQQQQHQQHPGQPFGYNPHPQHNFSQFNMSHHQLTSSAAVASGARSWENSRRGNGAGMSSRSANNTEHLDEREDGDDLPVVEIDLR